MPATSVSMRSTCETAIAALRSSCATWPRSHLHPRQCLALVTTSPSIFHKSSNEGLQCHNFRLSAPPYRQLPRTGHDSTTASHWSITHCKTGDMPGSYKLSVCTEKESVSVPLCMGNPQPSARAMMLSSTPAMLSFGERPRTGHDSTTDDGTSVTPRNVICLTSRTFPRLPSRALLLLAALMRSDC